MRDYGIVSPRFWIGETGKKLRGDANCQVLAMYLMTSPHATMTGVYHCPVLYMAHETGLSMEGATKALARLSEEGFVEYDPPSEYIFVVNMAFWQIGESLKPGDNRISGLKRDVEKMHKRFKSRFLEVYSEAFHLGQAPKKVSPSEAPPEPLPSQDQDQEQEQEQEEEAPPKAAKCDPVDQALEEIRNAYPRRSGSHRWNDARGAYRERLREGSTHEEILAGVKRYAVYIRTAGNEGTSFVQQAATFLGKNRGYLEDWKPEPPKPKAPVRYVDPPRTARMFGQ